MFTTSNRARRIILLAAALAAGATSSSFAGGILTPTGSPEAPIQIRDHHVDVVINNGFSRTEVIQTFFNPNNVDLEAIYSFPVPRSASLSEVTITIGEREIHGEVLPKDEARAAYEEERDQGKDSGLAEKNEFYTYDFSVSPVRAQDETRVRFVYYQPIEIDTGVGRYVYPLEEGGTDEVAMNFWTTNDVIEGAFSIRVELKSAWPVTDVHVPGFAGAHDVKEIAEGHYVLEATRTQARLDRDFVLYYKLADDLPGRVELLTYRASPDAPGTFMLLLTPGLDLQPIDRGSDYVFVLDVSGSMGGDKIRALADGVSQSIGYLDGEDRVRIVTFAERASELTRGWVAATPENVANLIKSVEGLRIRGGTNLYAGLEKALKKLDDDRATSLVLVTDAVTNTGVVDPAAFHKLMKRYDIRVFGFLMGNSANWPLMRTICEASGGFHTRISTADDLLGQVILAKSKITHECLHDATLSVRGVETWSMTGAVIGKVYRGQQLVFFGRYDKPAEATLTLETALSGKDRTYRTSFPFPEIDERHPELERLWALARIEETQTMADAGLTSPGEAEDIVTDLGVEYQIVTDHTSMVVLSDESFTERGIERRNRDRVAVERSARSARAGQAVRSTRVDGGAPMFPGNAPHVTSGGGGGGGGAIDPVSAALALAIGIFALLGVRGKIGGGA